MWPNKLGNYISALANSVPRDFANEFAVAHVTGDVKVDQFSSVSNGGRQIGNCSCPIYRAEFTSYIWHGYC